MLMIVEVPTYRLDHLNLLKSCIIGVSPGMHGKKTRKAAC